MQRYALCIGLLGCGASLAWSQSTGSSAVVDGFSDQEWTVINTLSPLPALPVDLTI